MAEAVISVVVETLGGLLIEEGKFLHGVKDQVDQLRADLKRMQWFLKDADGRQNEAKSVGEWVSQTRDLAYEAENLLEHYAFKVESRRRRGIIKRCCGLLDEILTRHRVGSEIKSLKAKLSDLTTSFRDYGIREIMENRVGPGGSSSEQLNLRRSYSHIVEDDLVGLQSQAKRLADVLVGGNHEVVSVWGMGGLGKTTLAKQVYHHPDVRCNFQVFCWVCVSQEWKMRNLLEVIITKFIPEKRELIKQGRDEELVRQLFEFQKEKKCLVVLDDIWSLEAWESIKVAFCISKKGSKVLLTTRNQGIATLVDASAFLHQPPLLNDEESWELFQKKSLIERRCQDSDEIQRKVKLGKEMVKHCGGLPLGIHVLGGILSTKHNLEEWEKVHKYVKSYIGKGDNNTVDQERLQNILRLSYNDLPCQLKPFFLYLSKYKEDADIEAESLYQIWMAEGLISMEDQIGDEPMIDVAERYLQELAKRCMVLVELGELTDKPQMLRFKTCRLHDIIRELCLAKAKEENFIQIISCRDKNDKVLLPSLASPRLAIDFFGSRKTVVFKVDAHSENSWKKVEKVKKDIWRSDPGVVFLTGKVVGTVTVDDVVDEAKIVNLIRKNGIKAEILKKPEEVKELVGSKTEEDNDTQYAFSSKEVIGNLRSFTCCIDGRSMALQKRMRSLLQDFKMLRVLSIEQHDFNYRVPSAIGKLIHLRYLSFRGSRGLRFLSLEEVSGLIIPSSISNLEHLQTLDLRCSSGVRIPNEVRKLKRLKHLYLGKLSCKFSLEGLLSLEILEGFDDEFLDVEVISSLTNLVSLTATIKKDVEEFIDHVNNLKRLRFLSLDVVGCDFSQDEKGSSVLKKLFSCTPLTHLKMTFGCIISKLPEYELHLAPNLHSLKLTNSRMVEDPMSTLEKLPNLRRLCLLDNSYEGEDMLCRDNAFRQLKYLRLKRLKKLNNWYIEEGAMPKISRISFEHCDELKTVPDGLRYLSTLKELIICSMPHEFKTRLQLKEGSNQQGEDFDMVRHVPSIKIYG